jgi:hypothetical protein
LWCQPALHRPFESLHKLCTTQRPPCVGAVSINAFGEIAGTHPYLFVGAPWAFTRSRARTFTNFGLGQGASYGTVLTGLNGSATIVGFYTLTGQSVESFEFDARGNGGGGIYVPINGGGDGNNGYEATIAEGVNASAVIVGWYTGCINPCTTSSTGAFVLSPQGEYTLFTPPGALVMLPRPGFQLRTEPSFVLDAASISAPHRLSINQGGTITGSYTDTAGAQHGFVRNPYGDHYFL